MSLAKLVVWIKKISAAGYTGRVELNFINGVLKNVKKLRGVENIDLR